MKKDIIFRHVKTNDRHLATSLTGLYHALEIGARKISSIKLCLVCRKEDRTGQFSHIM